MTIALDLIGQRLQSIQAELSQIKFAADVDRRNAVSQYDNLVVSVGVKIGAFEGTIEHQLHEIRVELNDRFDSLNVRFDRIEALLKGTAR